MNSKIKVCHISQSAGGVETYILSIIKNSDKNKFHHIVICYDNGTLAEKAPIAGAEVIMIPMVREINPVKDLKSFLSVHNELKKIKPNIIHAHSAKGGMFGRISGKLLSIPVLFSPNAFSYMGLSGVKKKIAFSIEKLLKPKNSYLLTCCESESEIAINEVKWSEKKIIKDFPNSLVPSEFSRTFKQKDKLEILTLSRFNFQKNPILFVEIANLITKKYPNVLFKIIGAGYADEQSQEVTEKISQYNLKDKIKIVNWCSLDEVREHLRNADIYLSTSRFEGLPFVLLEAMDYELPLVVSNVPGNKDLVTENFNGYKANSINEFIIGLSALIEDSEKRLNYGKNSKILLNTKYNLSQNIVKLESLYSSFSI
ncbi:MAG TPA: glycosyltransferase [Ignavibacteria bacterium]|nr:glycosyltransferase [Ignavibacteria bacterium]